MLDDETTVAELRNLLRRFVKDRKWERYHTPKNLSMSMAIEAAELMEHFQWLTPKEAKDLLKKDARAKEDVAAEMADVFAYLLSLANAADIDLASSLEKKMAHNEEKYPTRLFKGNYTKRRAQKRQR